MASDGDSALLRAVIEKDAGGDPQLRIAGGARLCAKHAAHLTELLIKLTLRGRSADAD